MNTCSPKVPVVLACVRSAHGVKGWLNLVDLGGAGAILDHQKQCWVQLNSAKLWSKWAISSVVCSQGCFRIKLSTLKDRNAAEALIGAQIAVERCCFQPTHEDEFYQHDLIGCQVKTQSGTTLGTVDSFLSAGGSDVMSILAEDGQQCLVPFVSAIVQTVDLRQRCITVLWEAHYG